MNFMGHGKKIEEVNFLYATVFMNNGTKNLH